MTAVRLRQVVGRLRGVLATRQVPGLSDADLLGRFVHRRDAAALEALVHRHGPMVLGVCRRILRHEQDAEDAFQATFLVLVRKAAFLRSPQTLANWLHGVARRTALEARTSAARRRAKEAAVLPRTEMPAEPADDLRPVLDQELGRLAEKYRVAIVLCDLEGKTRGEVARQLGWAEGTVASRLARGRNFLAKRLARRGFGGALVASALSGDTLRACLPARLVDSTVMAASLSPAGAATAGVISLSEEVLKSMLLTKIKTAVATVLVLGVATLGAGGLLSRTLATEPPGQTPPDPHDQVLELKKQFRQLEQKLASLERQTQSTAKENVASGADILARRFKHRVPFEIGRTQTAEGGRIEIREVWGTRPKIEVGGQYLVRGKYALPPGQRGKIYFYITAEGAWNQAATLDLQTVEVDQREGEFALVHGMSGPGCFHLYLADPENYQRYFANVYFGTGDNVWREKP
jgi:RNA polymerase sigma factor (sigma-70 family)